VLERLKQWCARLWRNQHFRRGLKFVLTGTTSTLLGFMIISAEVNRMKMEQNLANYIQATILFVVFFAIYRLWVFEKGATSVPVSVGRWLLSKSTSAFLVAPFVFFLVSLSGTPYWVNYFCGAAVSGAYSFVLGYWSFGHGRERVE